MKKIIDYIAYTAKEMPEQESVFAIHIYDDNGIVNDVYIQGVEKDITNAIVTSCENSDILTDIILNAAAMINLNRIEEN